MDPQTFIRLSIGSLGLRVPMTASKAIQAGEHFTSSPWSCEIRLRGFPMQTVIVPLISSSEANPDPHANPAIFYLGESDVKALMAPGCFHASKSCLEITVYTQSQGSHCGISGRKQQLGTFRLDVGREWGDGRPVLLHNGWTGLGKNRQEKGKQGPELHLRVKLDPDPRYVFQFEDETALSPQIVQLQGTIKQPIFSCKFSRERRASQLDLMSYWSNSEGNTDHDTERRERKGWRVMIHDLSGSAVAAAFMATPFVPSTGSNRVARSNPGAWLILRPDPVGPPESWHPWGRLEAWRESGGRGSVCYRLHLLPDGQECGVLVSDILINTDKGGEFFIDMDRQTPVGAPVPCMDGSNSQEHLGASFHGAVAGGFVMNCRVRGEGKSSKPLVQLAMRHVTCVEDAAIFVALAAAVDLSIAACRPFRRKPKKFTHFSSLVRQGAANSPSSGC